MSKQQDAKTNQGYQAKPIFPMCSNCKHYNSDMVNVNRFYGDFKEEKNIRCGLGGFAVKKQGTCNSHSKSTI